MTIEELSVLYAELKNRVDALHDLNFKNITEFDQLPAIDFDDTLLVVTSADYTGRATIEQIMEYLNKNLRNFICWKPVVNNSTLSWERSSSDEAPGEIKFENIMFPMASETTNGMMTSADYLKLSSIDAEKIVYNDTLNDILDEYASKEHVHEQYQLKSEMPTKLSDFENDEGYLKKENLPTKISAFENDVKYLKVEDLPIVNSEHAGLMTPAILSMIADLSDESITPDELNEALDNIMSSFPTKVSELDNDAEYVSKENFHSVFGELGVVNILNNGEFRFTTYSEENATEIIDGWTISNGTFVRYTEDVNYPRASKATFTTNTVLRALLTTENGNNSTVTFYAKADTSARFSILLGDGSASEIIGTTWAKYTFTITDNGTDPSMYLRFIMTDEEVTENVLYLSQVKVEDGKLSSEFYPSYPDLEKLIKEPATLTTYGAILPDGNTLGFDSDGKLRVTPESLKLGGEVMVKYDYTENYMYFVFPE